MRVSRFFLLFGASQIVLSALSTYLLLRFLADDRPVIIPLTNELSITDHRRTLDANWLKSVGFRTLIYMRHDGFLDVFDHRTEEESWIAEFADGAQKAGLKFYATKPHDRKHFKRNAFELRQALDQSDPPILIYSDKSRDGGVFWALAEASRPCGLPLDKILSAAESFRPFDQHYRETIAAKFSRTRDGSSTSCTKSIDSDSE
jgi:uncharacterized protein (TIGR01244 family)